MYCTLQKLKVATKIDMEKVNSSEQVKVKEEIMDENYEYSEVNNGVKTKENKNIVDDSRNQDESKILSVVKDPTAEKRNHILLNLADVKKEPLVEASVDSDDSSEKAKNELVMENASNYISAESFKRNMQHMFPKVHADIIDTFKRDFCGLCGAQFDSEKRAWTHYFSPEHDHAVKKGKKYPYPPFWLMIKLALAEFKPAGASKKDIRDFLLKSYPAVKALKESEFYDRLGKNLVEMVTHFKNVVIDEDGLYKLGVGGNQYPHQKHPKKYFTSDKRFYIPEDKRASSADSHKSGRRYRDQMERSRGGHLDQRARGVESRRDKAERKIYRGRSRSRSRDRSERKHKSSRREERSSYRESFRREKSINRKQSRRSRSRSRSRSGEKRSRYESRASRDEGLRNSGLSRTGERVDRRPSPEKVSPPPLANHPTPLQLPMFPFPGTGDGNHPQPIIIIPSNMSSPGFPSELLAGNFGGLQMLPPNSMLPQMSRGAYPFPTQALYQVATPGTGLPTPPLSTSPPEHGKI